MIVITLAIVGGGVWALQLTDSPSAPSAATENARATLQEMKHDWGSVSMKDGTVTKTFTIANEGTEPLVLSDVTTSCMCTTAQLKLGGETSPVFDMHGKSSYTMSVPPQETAELEVIFDPAFHGPSGVGDITRIITVRTNDAASKELTFTLTATVTP